MRLAWATALGKNSRAFEVERSADGASFAKEEVAAASTTATAHACTFLGPLTLLPISLPTLHYRLRAGGLPR